LIAASEASDHRVYKEAARNFVERVTFATAHEITEMLRQAQTADWMALPPLARNLSDRLARLQTEVGEGLVVDNDAHAIPSMDSSRTHP
jgi:hypothetical protein